MNLSMPDLSNLTWAGVGDWLVGTPLLILTIVVVGLVARFVLHRLIDRVVATATSRRAERLASIPGAGRALQAVGVAQRAPRAAHRRPMGALLKSITTFVVLGITALTVMSLVGHPARADARLGQRRRRGPGLRRPEPRQGLPVRASS